MNPLRKAWGAIRRLPGRAAKQFSIVFRGTQHWVFDNLLARTNFDYKNAVGDGTKSNIIVAITNWAARNFPEAPLQVREEQSDGTDEVLVNHPMIQRINRPNSFYSGVLLWMATIVDWSINGNTYWAKVRSGAGRIVELWWLPSWLVEAKWPADGSAFISHYEYSPNFTPIRIEVEDIVHFRFGLDPNNTRKGTGSLASLVREVFTDEEAANFTASILRNIGVPGVTISPADKDVAVDKEQADDIRDRFTKTFGGDNRGVPMVMSLSAKIDRMSFSPQELDLKALRRIPEERACAVLGIPAIVVGLGAGLDRSTFSNVAEAREMAYENFIIPTQRIMAAELDLQLLPDFGNEERERTHFDTSKVRVLQEDQTKMEERLSKRLTSGGITVAEYRSPLGLEVRPEHEIYLRPINLIEVPVGTMAPPLDQEERADDTPEMKASVGRGRGRRIVAASRRIAPFLDAQAARVRERFLARQGGQRSRNGAKLISVADLFPPEELEELQRLMRGIHGTSIDAAAVLAEELVAGGQRSRKQLDDLTLGAIQGRLGINIQSIDAATQQFVASEITLGQTSGLTSRQIANGLVNNYGFSPQRALAIARTELAAAENWTASAVWRQVGVDQVSIIDGPGCGWTSHDDPDVADGSFRSLDELDQNPTSHPNCVRVPIPVAVQVVVQA